MSDLIFKRGDQVISRGTICVKELSDPTCIPLNNSITDSLICNRIALLFFTQEEFYALDSQYKR